MRAEAFASLFLGSALCLACGGSGGTAPNEPPPPPRLVLEKVGTDPLSVVAGDAFSDSVRVIVHDADGTAKPGVTITFGVSAGGGSVSPTSVVTDAGGRAAAHFVTGTAVGRNTATASITGASAVQFSTTTIAGPIASLSVTAPVVVLDSGAAGNIALTAHDRYGNAASTSGVSFTSRAPEAVTVDGTGRLTALAPGQGFVVAARGSAADSTLVIAAHSTGPVVRTDLTEFRLPADTSLTVNVLADMRSSAEKFGSGTVIVSFDPALLTLVESTAIAPGTVVNATAAGSGQVTIAAADANGLPGSVTLAALTFRVTGASGHAGAIDLDTRELTAAVTFDALLPRTLSVSTPLVIR